MTEREALKLALEALEKSHICPLLPDDCSEAITAIKEALAQPEHGWTPERIAGIARLKEAQDKRLAQPEQEPVACVYKATTKKGETAHFGEYSAAKAWAGWGTVEQVPLKTLTLISKSINPCPTCEALARTVMLDQTSHDTTPPQRKPLTDEQRDAIARQAAENDWHDYKVIDAVEAAHGIRG